MSKVCEAYQFQPLEFAEAVAPHVIAMNRDPEGGYRRLCASVIDLFERNPQVEQISLEFGANDLAAVRALAAEDGHSQKYIGCMLAFMLYGHFRSAESCIIGSDESTMALGEYLQSIGWEADDALLLIRGHNFTEFARKYGYAGVPSPVIPEYWKYVHPASAAASEGWVAPSEVKRLVARLLADEKKLPPARQFGIPNYGMKMILDDFQSAKRAYLAAQKAGCGLVIICSD